MEGGGGQSPRAEYEVSLQLTCLLDSPQPPHHTQDTGGGQKDTYKRTQPVHNSPANFGLSLTSRAKMER